MRTMSNYILEVDNLSFSYGNIQTLKDISISIKHNQIVTLIGANGAGKTTLINSISGFLKPILGSIRYLGNEISLKNPSQIVRLGISQSPEGRRVFPQMTVLENLEMGAYSNISNINEKEDLEWIYNCFPVLSDRKKQIASTLSGGEQQMLAIGRALMSRPQLLLLDEPSMGLAPNMVKKIFEIIQKIHARGISILLVEQNAYMALSIAEKAYVLEGGHISMEDSGKNLLNNPEVMKSYLGEVTNVSRRNNRNLYS